MPREIEEQECEIQVQVGYDAFMRNFHLSIHCDTTMSPQMIIDELAEVVARYSADPDLLFDDSEIIEQQ